MSQLANRNVTAKVVRALQRAGFSLTQGGNHAILEHPDGRYTTVPRHPRLNVKTLKSILKQCGLSGEQFARLY